MSETLLLLGLGNWEIKDTVNRHNFGYLGLDYIRKSFPSFERNLSNENFPLEFFDIEKSFIKTNGKNTFFYTAKIKDYMNLTGKYLIELFNETSCNLNNLVIISDDLDIDLGHLKIDKNIGSGNHQGISSIINCLSSKNFIRIRIGAGPRAIENTESLAGFVLEKLNKKEKDLLDLAFFDLPGIIETLLVEDLAYAQNNRNSKNPF
jgi:PTH1 family peptidyl-tRNA hydrolase